MHVCFDILGRTLMWWVLQSTSPVAAAADSIPPAPSGRVGAAADTTAAAPDDSLSTATPADSLAAGASGVADEPRPDAVDALPPPWSATATLGARAFAEIHPGLLAEALTLLPEAALRVGGDWGAPAYLSLGPLGGPAPEIVYDGVPSRSPGDLDPAVWDRSAIPLVSLGVAGLDAPPGGEPRLLAETVPLLAGRTHTRTHFTREAHDSYLRGVWVATPAAARALRFEFEEWKTEDGHNFTLDPRFDTLPEDFGRSKMRRFRVTADAVTAIGRASVSFGRGRRLYRGTVLGTGDTERWTGEVSAGVDRSTTDGYWRLRAFHLDFNDDDDAHAEHRDASRLGLRLARVPTSEGWGTNLAFERWSAAFVSGAQVRRPSPAYVARVAGSWRARWSETLGSTAVLEGVYAEHAIEHFDGAGGVAVTRQLTGAFELEAAVMRRVRVPTLLETGGWITTDVADGSILSREGAGPLPLERQDRAHATIAGEGETWSASVTAESWRLTRGIGYEPAADRALTVGGLELTLHQVCGTASLRGGSSAAGWSLTASGQRVLGPLSHARDRGTGWPLWSALGRARAWRQVSSRHNRGFLEAIVHSIGPRFDDAQAALNGARLATQTRVDARAGLKIRDAELYLAWRNLLDTELVEVSGTRRRGREVRLGLHWPFFN